MRSNAGPRVTWRSKRGSHGGQRSLAATPAACGALGSAFPRSRSAAESGAGSQCPGRRGDRALRRRLAGSPKTYAHPRALNAGRAQRAAPWKSVWTCTAPPPARVTLSQPVVLGSRLSDQRALPPRERRLPRSAYRRALVLGLALNVAAMGNAQYYLVKAVAPSARLRNPPPPVWRLSMRAPWGPETEPSLRLRWQ